MCPRARFHLLLGLALLLGLGACQGSVRDTTSARSSTETLVLSTAAERAIEQLDPAPWSGKRVWIDESWLECLDEGYVLSALHERLARGGCLLVAVREAAEVVIEVRSAGLGTWDASYALGIPELPVGDSGVRFATPPLTIGLDVQQGWARLQLFAYARESGAFLGQATLWGAASEDPLRGVYPPLLERLTGDEEGE